MRRLAIYRNTCVGRKYPNCSQCLVWLSGCVAETIRPPATGHCSPRTHASARPFQSGLAIKYSLKLVAHFSRPQAEGASVHTAAEATDDAGFQIHSVEIENRRGRRRRQEVEDISTVTSSSVAHVHPPTNASQAMVPNQAKPASDQGAQTPNVGLSHLRGIFSLLSSPQRGSACVSVSDHQLVISPACPG